MSLFSTIISKWNYYVFKIIKPNAWMASVALKDVFFTIPIHESHQKYFKFE